MARDLSRIYVSYFRETLGNSVYPACGIHGLLPEDKEFPDKLTGEYKHYFKERMENLIRHASRTKSDDSETKITRSILEKYFKECLPADWTDTKAMQAIYKRTREVQELLERRQNRDFRYASDFRDAIAVPICHAYGAHLRIIDAESNPPRYLEFNHDTEPKTDAERRYRERITEEYGIKAATKRSLENTSNLMKSAIESSREEFEKNLAALDRKYSSDKIDPLLKERTDSFTRNILSADWGELNQIKTIYNQALSEADWLNNKLDSMK